MPPWYSHPVLFVTDVERSLAFYTEKRGFTEGPRYVENGLVLLGQVSREDRTVLLNCQQPGKVGRARMFISLDAEPFLALRAEFAQRGATTREGWWGYDTLIVEYPDGNEWFFPYPDEVARGAVN